MTSERAFPTAPWAAATVDRAERDFFAWALLAGLLLLAALAWPFFAGRAYLGGELGDFHLPARAFYAQQLARGEPFDWMPGIFAGFYLTGEGQAGTYHPLHWLLYRFLPLRTALGWEYLSSYPVMAAGLWVLLRRRLRRRDAAMLGSLAFTFSSFNLLHFSYPNAVAATAHLPWLLAMIDVILVDARRSRVAAAQMVLALATGSQILLGCPQYVWFSLLAEIAYVVLLLRVRQYMPRNGCEVVLSCRDCVGCYHNALPRVILAKGLGLLVGGVQLVPTLDALGQSTRQAAAGAAAAGGLDPINLVQLVAPYLPAQRVFGGSTELGLYVGAVPLLLAVCALAWHRKLGGLGPLAWGTAGFGALALTLAMAGSLPLVRLHGVLPGCAWLRFPCRYSMLFQFSVAVLAAIGFALVDREARLARRLRQPRTRTLAGELWRDFEPLWAVVLAGVAVAGVGWVLQGKPAVGCLPGVLAGPLILAAATILLIAAAKGVRGAMIGLILLAAADLGCYGLSFALAEPTDLFAAAWDGGVHPPAEAASAGARRSRVFAPRGNADGAPAAVGNQMTLAGWQRLDGYAELEPRRELNYLALPALRAGSARWVLGGPATSSIPGLVPRDGEWLEVPNPLPRVRLIGRVVASQQPAEDLGQIDVARAALAEYDLALPPGPRGCPDGEATLLDERPGWMHIRVRCCRPRLLVVSESFHRGWRCLVDGRPQPVLRINGDFLGCPVAAGESQVLLEFRPTSLLAGWLASITGLALVFCCFLGSSVSSPWRRRGAPQPQR
ncbi:MAG: hypothetical protein ABSG86_02615 [Thermoguttaceae bacterium]|jgi:hypothetical protein